MNKILTLICILYINGLALSQQTIIPDVNFENALIAMGYDTDPANGSVPTANIDTIITLDLRLARITDLTGIEDFAALDSLILILNMIQNLDVSQNLNLGYLDCTFNEELNTLDLGENERISYLNIDNCALTSLDLSPYSALRTLIAINIDELTCLTVRNGNNINFETFNISNCPNLTCVEVDDSVFSMNNWPDTIGTPAVFSEDCNNECSVVTDIAEKSFTDLRYGPNPTTDILSVKLGSTHSEIIVTIYNINGQKVFNNSYSNAEIVDLNIPGSSGLYFVQIASSSGERSLIRVMKQ